MLNACRRHCCLRRYEQFSEPRVSGVLNACRRHCCLRTLWIRRSWSAACAQRLSASLLSAFLVRHRVRFGAAPCSTPVGVIAVCVWRGSRYHSAGAWCSTPVGVIAVCVFVPPTAGTVRLATCSTPVGVIAVCVLKSDAATLIGNGAQRLSASLLSAYCVAETTRCNLHRVLNACRRHCCLRVCGIMQLGVLVLVLNACRRHCCLRPPGPCCIRGAKCAQRLSASLLSA